VREQNLAVEAKPGGRRNQITITGPDPDFGQAVELVGKLDVAPPPPNFVLSGVIITPRLHYAAINVDGRYYTLLEGESMPDLGWTVKQITPTRVTLTKGKQHVELRLSGGS
jgi:hypothetical protein